MTVRCATCYVDWSSGRFSEDCEECGGGAMERGCIICGGRCGAIFERAVGDSNDSGVAHWLGRCLLPRK